MKIFQTENLTASYGKNIILNNINFTINRGEFLSIIGPNGAGKSTLLNILSGENPTTQGKVFFKDKDMTTIKRNLLAGELSIVHQERINPHPFTVYEFIKMGRFPHQKLIEMESTEDKKIIAQAIELTAVEKLKFKKITELSTGEMQLVNLARAFVQSEKVILLDEPISHLDLHHSIKIMDILKELNSRGSTIISILHDINVTISYSKRVVALKGGEIFLDGNPEKVLNRESLKNLYDINFTIFNNPETGKPVAFPVSDI